MDSNKKVLDESHNIANRLEKLANDKCIGEIEKSKAYCEGYNQGVEDFAREMRNTLRNIK